MVIGAMMVVEAMMVMEAMMVVEAIMVREAMMVTQSFLSLFPHRHWLTSASPVMPLLNNIWQWRP
eukprot:6584241-Lingulodinium_polyedra.AAC.1